MQADIEEGLKRKYLAEKEAFVGEVQAKDVESSDDALRYVGYLIRVMLAHLREKANCFWELSEEAQSKDCLSCLLFVLSCFLVFSA